MDLSERIRRLSHSVRHTLARTGAVVQVSGGIDSAVTLHLAARALGPDRVAALFLPDRATSPVSAELARQAAASADCQLHTTDIDPLVVGLVAPAENARVIRSYFSDYNEQTDGYAINIDTAASLRLGVPAFRLHVGPIRSRGGRSALLKPTDLRKLMAAQNVKQRLRMTVAYARAEEYGYAVVGASNADEIELGFTVKFGDEAADVYAIADVHKSEVRELAKELSIPADIQARTPTTDTFTLEQSQSEYYYIADPEALRSLDLGETSPYNKEAMASIADTFRKTAHYNQLRIHLDDVT